MNHIIFFFHTIFITGTALYSFFLGREALIAFICLQGILANLFVIKGITFLGISATAADGYIIGGMCGFHLLQEFHGKEYARKTIFISFVLLLFYTIVSQIHLVYIPATSDITQPHFAALFNYMPRIVAASLTAYGISQYTDLVLFGLLKKLFNGNYFVVRNYLCATVSQLVDTLLFAFLGLYGVVPHIEQVILISYGIKMIGLLVSSPCMLLAKKLYSLPLATE